MWVSVLRSKIAEQILFTMLSRSGIVLLGGVMTILVSRALQPDGRGLYALATTVTLLGVQFGRLGMDAANAFFAAKHPSWVPRLIANGLILSAGGGGLLITGGILIHRLWYDLLPLPDWLLLLALCGIIPGIVYQLHQQLLVGLENIQTANRIEFVEKALGVLLFLALFLAQSKRVEFYVAVILATMIFIALWSMRALLRRNPAPIHHSKKLFKVTLLYGFRAYLCLLFYTLLFKGNLWLVQYFLGSSQTGYYSIALSIVDLLLMIICWVIGMVLFPKLVKTHNDRLRWKTSLQSAFGAGIIMLVTCIFLSVLAEPVIRILFGQAFLPSVPVLILSMPGMIALAINTMLVYYSSSLGVPTYAIVLPAIAAVLNLVLAWELIPLFGLEGAVWASNITYGMMLLGNLFFCRKPIAQRAAPESEVVLE